MKRLHIVGCPRSGTTLLMELVSTCFESGGYCEHEQSLFEPVPEGGDVYFTKQPNDIKLLRHVFPRDPALYIIYLGRDPRAVVTSRHRESPGRYFCNYRVWRECERAARRYEGHPRFLRVRYENLVTGPDAVQADIAARFSFLRQRHRFSEYPRYASPSPASGRAMNGLRDISRESLEKWRQHLPRVAEQYRRHPELAGDLIQLGYERDRAWLRALGDVTPVVYPCRYSERRARLREWERAVRVYFKSRRYLRQRGA